MPKLPPDYENRVYAGWLGKCIGVRFGAPLEGWTYQEIRDNLGEVTEYLPLPSGKLFSRTVPLAPVLIVCGLVSHSPERGSNQLILYFMSP